MANLLGQKSFLTIYTEVCDEISNSTPANMVNPSLSRVKAYINNAYHQILNKYEWWFLFKQFSFNTVQGTHLYALDPTAAEVMQMNIPALTHKLRFISREVFASRFPQEYSGVGQVRPLFYIPASPDTVTNVNGLQYDLWPTPDQAYAVDYWAKILVADLSADSDVPYIPTQWQDVITYRAIADAYQKIQQFDMSARFLQRYEELINDMWRVNEAKMDWISSLRDIYEETPMGHIGIVYPYIG